MTEQTSDNTEALEEAEGSETRLRLTDPASLRVLAYDAAWTAVRAAKPEMGAAILRLVVALMLSCRVFYNLWPLLLEIYEREAPVRLSVSRAEPSGRAVEPVTRLISQWEGDGITMSHLTPEALNLLAELTYLGALAETRPQRAAAAIKLYRALAGVYSFLELRPPPMYGAGLDDLADREGVLLDSRLPAAGRALGRRRR